MLWLPLSPGAVAPFVRIPLLVTAGVLYRIASRPPNPISNHAEIAKYGGKRDLFSRPWVWVVAAYGIQGIWWTAIALETAQTVLRPYPSLLPPDIHSATPGITPSWLAGCAIMLSGASLRMWCFRTLGRFFTFDLSVKQDHQLVTVGPYSVVRHPSYVGSALMASGSILVLLGPGSWARVSGVLGTVVGKVAAAVWVAYSGVLVSALWGRVNKEDRVLKEKFGSEWDVYANRTRYRLIPFVY